MNPDQQSTQACLQQAIGLHNQGELREAIRLYTSILEREPTNADALHLTAHALNLLELPEMALPWVDRALQTLPTAPVIWHTRASILSALRRYPEALESVERSLALEPNFAPAQHLAGRLAPFKPGSPKRIYIDTEYGTRECQIVLSLECGQWQVDVIKNSDTSKISNEDIIGATQDFLREWVPVNEKTSLAGSDLFSLKEVSISLFNWRDLLCGRVREVLEDQSWQAQTPKLGAFGYLAGTGQVASKPTRLKFIEYARSYPEQFEYIETDKFAPQMKNQLGYVEYKQRFQYIIDLPGHHFLTKFYWMLFARRTLFYVRRDLAYDWEKRLEPFVHYVPLKEDLSDLLEKYAWAREHPEECRKLAENALDFGMNELSERHVKEMMAERIKACLASDHSA